MWSTLWLFCSLIVLALVSSARSNSQQKNFGPVWVTGCHAIQIVCLSRCIKFFPLRRTNAEEISSTPPAGKKQRSYRTLLASKQVCSRWLYSTYMYLHLNLLSGQWWLLTLNHSDDMDILQKELVQNTHSCVKQELKYFTTLYMQLPPPAVFHDKAKRTQQGNLLVNCESLFYCFLDLA